MTAGELVLAILTILCSGGAAFIGARVSKRSTDVEDKRERDQDKWGRIDKFVSMAVSENDTEAALGMYHLEQAKSDWNDDPELRKYITRTVNGLTDQAVQAYHEGATTIVTAPPPNPPVTGGGPVT